MSKFNQAREAQVGELFSLRFVLESFRSREALRAQIEKDTISMSNSDRVTTPKEMAPHLNTVAEPDAVASTGEQRYSFLRLSSAASAHALSIDTIQKTMADLGLWLDSACRSTGEEGCCHRTALFHQDGRITWLYPHSNCSELIRGWLDLGASLQDRRYRNIALSYANRLIDDPLRGLYNGPVREAGGMMWYWRDDGTYTGGYSMRIPGVFLRLQEELNEKRFAEASIAIGETFLRRQLSSGAVNMVAWSPDRGWFAEDTMGSRYAYCVATFASLYSLTQDRRYKAAYELAVQALLKMQQPDGSFFQFYDPVSLEPQDQSIKIHFFAYLFNAMEEAYAVFPDERLLACGMAMKEYLAGLYYYRRQLPYCYNAEHPSDLVEADSAVYDSASGLLWLYQVTGDPTALDLGIRLWNDARGCQLDCPEYPGFHGALIRGQNPLRKSTETAAIPVAHLQFDPTRVASCEVWFAANYIFGCKKLLHIAQSPLGKSVL